MKKSQLAQLFALSVFIRATVAHADLVPPGGEGVNACRDKKAGDACENYVIDEAGQHLESGKCVEEKLDHLHFKFKAHLRCVSASVPKPPASAATPPSAAPAPSTAPIPSATASSAPATIPSTSPPDTPKSSGCSLATEPMSNDTSLLVLLGMGLLFARRRVN